MTQDVSIRPSDMVDVGVVPVDKNLLVKESRFVLFDYQGKAPQVTAARLVLLDDDGIEAVQHYSVADPTRFVPSQDGKSLVAVGTASAINKSSNFHILMENLVSAGFPENKLGKDISAIEGLYAYWIGVPEPTRAGLQRTPEQAARQRVIPVPSQILRLPWEKGKGKTATKATPKAEEVANRGSAADIAVGFVNRLLDETGGSLTRQQVAVRMFRDLASDPERDAIAGALFAPGIQAALTAAGLTVKGETISK